MGWLMGPVDPEDDHFQWSSELVRFHSPNSLVEQINTIANRKHRRSQHAGIPSRSILSRTSTR
jgi:hypothetical protein